MRDLHFYIWALMHSDKFSLCYFRLPIEFRARKSHEWGVNGYVLSIAFLVPRLYVPYEVKEQYWAAQGDELLFDDLPF